MLPAVKLPRLELDVNRPELVAEACELAFKHAFPAIVVPPELVTAAIINRGLKKGRFSILTGIDWPKGDNYGQLKFRGVQSEALQADGYEVLLTGRNNPSQVLMEIKYLSEFFRSYFPPTCQVRYVLGTDIQSRPDSFLVEACKALKQIPLPAMIRTSANTRQQLDHEGIKELAARVKGLFPAPLKLSGAVTLETVKDHSIGDRLGVSLQQAKELIHAATESIKQAAS
jgi:hypothetical protein